MKIMIRKKIRSTSKSESKTMPCTMSRALTLAPPLTPLPNLDLTRSPSLDGPGATCRSRLRRGRDRARRLGAVRLLPVIGGLLPIALPLVEVGQGGVGRLVVGVLLKS